ncbi:hypothetical protein C8Q70DRAFT_361295 [Cubamyces menziesii]|nr:hypothetical protein C8Q70DRAFT_361295 [Cubamyces menziesii]
MRCLLLVVRLLSSVQHAAAEARIHRHPARSPVGDLGPGKYHQAQHARYGRKAASERARQTAAAAGAAVAAVPYLHTEMEIDGIPSSADARLWAVSLVMGPFLARWCGHGAIHHSVGRRRTTYGAHTPTHLTSRSDMGVAKREVESISAIRARPREPNGEDSERGKRKDNAWRTSLLLLLLGAPSGRSAAGARSHILENLPRLFWKDVTLDDSPGGVYPPRVETKIQEERRSRAEIRKASRGEQKEDGREAARMEGQRYGVAPGRTWQMDRCLE